MRTSLNEIKEIEDHIFGSLAAPEALLFDAKTILNEQLREDVMLQKSVYHAVKQYSRKKLKHEIEMVHQQLMQPEHKGFMQRMMNLFLKL